MDVEVKPNPDEAVAYGMLPVFGWMMLPFVLLGLLVWLGSFALDFFQERKLQSISEIMRKRSHPYADESRISPTKFASGVRFSSTAATPKQIEIDMLSHHGPTCADNCP